MQYVLLTKSNQAYQKNFLLVMYHSKILMRVNQLRSKETLRPLFLAVMKPGMKLFGETLGS